MRDTEDAPEPHHRTSLAEAFPGEGCGGLPNATKARRMVLPDADVLRIVGEAYAIDRSFGLLVEVLAQTGARASQADAAAAIRLSRPVR